MRWDYGTIYKKYGNQNILARRKFVRVTFQERTYRVLNRTKCYRVLS